jgi:hypothetical protein
VLAIYTTLRRFVYVTRSRVAQQIGPISFSIH